MRALKSRRKRLSGTDDVGGDNFDEWWGRADLAFVTQSNDFNGKIPRMDVSGRPQGQREYVRQGFYRQNMTTAQSLPGVHGGVGEADREPLNFQLGPLHRIHIEERRLLRRLPWTVTQGAGKSGAIRKRAPVRPVREQRTSPAEAAFVSTESHLNKGDLRLMFHFRKLASIGSLTSTSVIVQMCSTAFTIPTATSLHTISLQGKGSSRSGHRLSLPRRRRDGHRHHRFVHQHDYRGRDFQT